MQKGYNITGLIKHMSRIAHIISDLIGTSLEQDSVQTILHEAYHQCCEVGQGCAALAAPPPFHQ